MSFRVLPGFYTISTDKHWTTEELVAAGRYFDASQYITSEHFPFRNPRSGQRIVKFFTSDEPVYYHPEVKDAFTGPGLEHPDHEDALLFGVQHPAVQEKELVVFFHEPWGGMYKVCASEIITCLWASGKNRKLSLDWRRRRWPAGTKFASIVKEDSPLLFFGN